uniref:Piwi domain-containing protein n=1 Tax=Ditylenchus dipsaci TaxID=166011 RepID=A0A915EWM8_9BILA
MVQIRTEVSSQSEQERTPLPEKLLNDGKIRNAQSTGVVLNAYELDTSFIDQVCKYELKFLGFFSSKKPKICPLGPKMMCPSILSHPGTFGTRDHLKQHVYDRGINMYSTAKLCKTGEKLEFAINMELLPERARVYLGKKITGISAQILACETVNLRSLGALEESGDRSVVQFLEILSSQEAFRRESHYTFGNKLFDNRGEIRLRADPRVLKEGMQKNIRFLGDSPDSAVAVLQIDPKKSPFFPNISVDVFLTEFLPGPPNARLHEKLNKNTLKMALNQIKGLTVSTTHMAHGRNRSFAISALTQRGPMRLRLSAKEKLFQWTNISSVPICKSADGMANDDNYYPMELCQIVAGQKVSLNQQTPQLTEQMIRNCQALPEILVNNDLQCAEAEVLFPPCIVYGRNQREEPDQKGFMKWSSMGSKQFIVPAKTPQVWAAALFQCGVEPNACNQFIDKFVNAAKAKGMQVERPNFFISMEQTDVGYIREKLKGCQTRKVKFIMFFTKDNRDDAHQRMKLMEIEYGIATQHVVNQTIQKALGNKGAYMVIDNLLLKFNLKLGGINHSLSAAHSLVKANGIGYDVVAREWLRDSRMFIGLDMSHAAPQTLYERQAKIACSEPTIVGMAYTLGHPLKMRGTYWCQQSRVTHIQQLADNIKEALNVYASQMNRYPQHLVVYRGGVSEGEYRIVLNEEQGAFLAAFKELENQPGFCTPKLTIIIVQRDSNYRIIPQEFNPAGRPFEQNVRAGTCVDQKIMHPSYTEFLLVGHKTIQGTARPVRCTVISDTCNPRVSLQELEYVTYSLCYAHGNVLSPVSVPAPLYSAADLSKRGRNNWKCKKNEKEEYGSEDGRILAAQMEEHLFINMNQDLKPTIPTKFWA